MLPLANYPYAGLHNLNLDFILDKISVLTTYVVAAEETIENCMLREAISAAQTVGELELGNILDVCLVADNGTILNGYIVYTGAQVYNIPVSSGPDAAFIKAVLNTITGDITLDLVALKGTFDIEPYRLELKRVSLAAIPEDEEGII